MIIILPQNHSVNDWWTFQSKLFCPKEFCCFWNFEFVIYLEFGFWNF